MFKFFKFMKITSKDKYPNRKFIETLNIENWEVETEDGWKDIMSISKTIKYNVCEIKLDNNLFLKCADTHIVIKYENSKYKECFIEDLKENDIIVTKNGFNKIIYIKNLNYLDEMYDLEINSGNHTYYTNNILSHNSTIACNLAAKSVLEGHNTAYITLELQYEIVNMRIGSNLLNIPLDDYEIMTQDQPLLKQKLTNLKSRALKPLGELHIKEFPSSTASANDISSYLRKAQELLGYKFDNIFIDYLNIMKNWRNPNTENTYMKIKQIAEDIRAMGQENNWAIISLSQINRSGWDSTDSNITSIAESAGLLHTVDLLFGIITNPEMKARGEYFLKCLANRVAGYENTKKRYTVDWKHLRIDEDRNSPIQDMEFFINNTTSGQKYPRGQKATTTTIDAIISNSIKPVDPTPDNIQIRDNSIDITGRELFNI